MVLGVFVFFVELLHNANRYSVPMHGQGNQSLCVSTNTAYWLLYCSSLSLHLSPSLSVCLYLSLVAGAQCTHTHAVCLYCWIAADEFIYEKEQTLCAIDWQDACNKCSLHVWMHTHHRVLWSSLFVFIAIVHSPLSSSAASSSSSLSSPTSSSYYYCLHPTEFVESRHRTDRSESFRRFAPSFFM